MFFSLIFDCFTVHQILISLNRRKHSYNFPFCKTVLLVNAAETFQSQLFRIIVVETFQFSANLVFAKKQMKILPISARSCKSLYYILCNLSLNTTLFVLCFLGSKVRILNMIMLIHILLSYQNCKQHVHSRLTLH